MTWLIALLLTIGCASTAVQDQEISRQDDVWTITLGGNTLAQSQAQVRSPDQTLQTTIQDPAHPDEPWTVTTYRRDGESELAFAMRHDKMVKAVREVLRDDQ